MDTTFEKFICFIFVVGNNFAYVVDIDASGSDIVFFKNINYFSTCPKIIARLTINFTNRRMAFPWVVLFHLS